MLILRISKAIFMKTDEYQGRAYDVTSTAVTAGEYRGVFDVNSTSPELIDDVINEATTETSSTKKGAEDAADALARRWIDIEADMT